MHGGWRLTLDLTLHDDQHFQQKRGSNLTLSLGFWGSHLLATMLFGACPLFVVELLVF